MKKTTIDASLLPNIWLTWETTKGVFYLDCTTGKKQIEAPERASRYDPNVQIFRSGSKPRFGYAKYHEDIEALELAEVTITTTRKEEPKQWKYTGEKYFLKKDKTVLNENGEVKTNSFTLSQYHHSYDFKGFLGLFYRIGYYKNTEEFKKFLGSDTYTVGSGRVVNVSAVWHIQEWYKTSQKVRGAGKQQKLTDKLVEMQVKDISEIKAKYPIKNPENSWRGNGLIEFERLEDGWSVLRVFNRSSNDFIEKERMYLHDDGASRIVAPTANGWIPARQLHTWAYFEMANKSEAMEKCQRLKYIIPHIEKENKEHIRNCLISILRFPEIEQMISLGHRSAARYVMNSQTPRADMKYIFGGYYNEKENSILRKVGLTKHQLDKHLSTYEGNNYSMNKCAGALLEMRNFFGENLIHLDNESFDNYYDGFFAIHRGYGRKVFSQLEYMNLDRIKFIKNAFRLGKKNPNVYTIIDDTLNRYNSLNRGTQPEINWYFDSYSDVVRAHDAIDELKRAQDAERRAMWDKKEAERLKLQEKKMIELDKERKVYEYEDDAYVIRLPKDLSEIVREGDRQRICIGGYTSRHAMGQTNIFFLRRKSEPDAPFYAIEMDNTNKIVQIHGYCNSWLGNNPDAIPTVVRWMRKNKIKCDEKILTCKAKGYGSVNDYVPMPVVD